MFCRSLLGLLASFLWAGAGFGEEGFIEGNIFADGQIRTVNGIAFEKSGTTLYVTEYFESPGGRRTAGIFSYHLVDGAWNEGGFLSFLGNHDAYQPTLSPDGSLMFFVSKRPLPGSDEEVRQNIWFVKRIDGEWGAPQIVPELVSPHWDGHAMLTESGWLYFASSRPGGKGSTDIYKCLFTEGRCPDPENVAALNSEAGDNDLYVDSKERFIIFQRSFDETRNLDLYFSVRRDGKWQTPMALSALNTTEHWEMSPFVTPDCEWLYFDRFDRSKPPALHMARLQVALGFDPCAATVDD